MADDSKPRTFNQLWTPEEQVIYADNFVHVWSSVVLKAKLEELLELYPPEEVESRRWEKIASALGNRTVKQVRTLIICIKPTSCLAKIFKVKFSCMFISYLTETANNSLVE